MCAMIQVIQNRPQITLLLGLQKFIPLPQNMLMIFQNLSNVTNALKTEPVKESLY